MQNRIFFFLVLCFFQTSLFADESAITLSYAIRPLLEKDRTVLEVDLVMQGDKSGVTELLLPSSWAGQEELYSEIGDLHCLSPDSTVENTDLPEVKRVLHPSDAPLRLRYYITPKAKQPVEWYYRPIVQPSHFFIFGHSLFVVPKGDEQSPAHITLEWRDLPAEWTLANSFGTQQNKQELVVPIGTLLDTVYLGGDFQIFPCGDPKSPLFVAIRGDWSFSIDRFIHLIQTIVETQRQFFNDFDFPYYLITVLPTGDDPHMGGTALYNTFSIFSGDLKADDKEDWKWLTWLLGHEHFHTWNGLKMLPDQWDGTFYWFTEGFTEYYAVKLNHRANLITFEDYINHINLILYDYYTSSVHQAKNEQIVQEFWKNWDIQRLPYVRGFLFALHWDQRIQDLSNGRYSLDDFMLALYKHTQDQHAPFSQADLERIANHFMPLEEVKMDIQKYIMNGETLLPTHNFHENCLVLWQEDIGFNVPLSQSTGKIAGVKDTGKAFAVGLRNGQKLISFQCTDQNVCVKIEDRTGKQSEMIYLRDSVIRLIPYYNVEFIKQNCYTICNQSKGV